MSDNPASDHGADVRRLLQTVTQSLREAPSMGPNEQRLLAELTDELSKVLSDGPHPSAEVTHLAESVSHFVQIMKQPRHQGLIASARERLDNAMIAAEVEAPLATGIVRRLMEALANLGI